MHKNPYHNAVDAYGNVAAGMDQRALEGKILLKSAAALEELSKKIASGEKVSLEYIGDTLEYNQKLWQLFLSEATTDHHPLPQEIKNNIASLALFVFKRTKDVLIETTPEKMAVLIEINRNIASGLLKAAKNAEREEKAEAEKASEAEKPQMTDSVI